MLNKANLFTLNNSQDKKTKKDIYINIMMTFLSSSRTFFQPFSNNNILFIKTGREIISKNIKKNLVREYMAPLQNYHSIHYYSVVKPLLFSLYI